MKKCLADILDMKYHLIFESQLILITVSYDPFVHTVLVIGFEMERFTADESQSVEVCVTIHDGGLETQVSVTLVTGEFSLHRM